MKQKTILCLTLILPIAAVVAADSAVDPSAMTRLQKRLERAINHHVPPKKIYDPASGEIPPPPFPRVNAYDAAVRKSVEDGIPKAVVNAKILALAEDYNSHLKPGVRPRAQDSWDARCMDMLDLMRQSKDRDFLPFIEKAGTTSADRNVRVAAVRAHVAMCGFDSFPFVKQAMAASMSMFPDTLISRNTRYEMADALLNPWWEETPSFSDEQHEEVFRYLLEQLGTEDEVFVLRLYDEYLLTHIPEYADSRQRATLGRFADTNDTWAAGTFAPVKAHFAAIPPSERPDLRVRFPDLPPLPEDSAQTAPRVRLYAAAAVTLLAVGIVLFRKARRARAG